MSSNLSACFPGNDPDDLARNGPGIHFHFMCVACFATCVGVPSWCLASFSGIAVGVIVATAVAVARYHRSAIAKSGARRFVTMYLLLTLAGALASTIAGLPACFGPRQHPFADFVTVFLMFQSALHVHIWIVARDI